ncbi:intracellular serine protease [Trichoderma arundinaceum]|uniref:Intracellular serine protease n=1 Tax=Trichoderma arundinaceum TaxID=490622 RepID=A0A395NZP3_TRIAR|nr:intracellular serine protease [Trichoderma arundinaceum]
MLNPSLQDSDHVSHGPSGIMDDGDDSGLDNEEEFLPPATTTSGFDVDHVKRQFDQDIEDARRLSQQSFTETERNKQRMHFILERQQGWDKTTWEGHNFLHYLAYDHNPKPSVSLQWLMARAIVKLPYLMGAMDKSKRTPLTAALSVGNERFSYAVCKNLGSKTLERIKPALMSECEYHDNDREVTCLHTALICDFSSEELREVIFTIICSFVPEKMFSVTDNRGRTPLHLAVEYERCCKTQVNIVKELLYRGPHALDVTISTYNRTFSVYQYHEDSRRETERRFTQRLTKEARDGKPKLNDSKSDLKKATTKLDTGAMGPPRLPVDRLGLVGSGVKRRDSIPLVSASRDREGHKLYLDTQVEPSSGRGSPIPSAQSAINSILQKEEEQAEAAKNISEQLKLLYLRTQTPDRASRSLRIQDEQGT